MKLLAVIIAASLWQASVAQDDFRDSLMNKIGDGRVNSIRVADILDDFYSNLTFVGACTESRQDRTYNRLLDEMRYVLGQVEFKEQIEEVVILLERDQFKEAIDKCDLAESIWRSHPMIDIGQRDRDADGCSSSRHCPGVAGGSRHAQGSGSAGLDKREVDIFRTYLSFLRAEASRLMGDIVKASGQISEVTFRRQHSSGVSINNLERLNALILLAKVSEFNQDIDKFFEIGKGPDFEQLREYRSTFPRPLTDPLPKKVVAQSSAQLGELLSNRRERLVGFKRRLSESRLVREGGLEMLDDSEIERRMPRGLVYQRVDPEQDNFRGQTVAKSSAKSILSEFAQKLVILGATSQTDYTCILDEMKEMNRDIVDAMQRQLEDYSQSTAESLQVGSKLWTRHTKTMQTYEKYFNAEIYSRSEYSCNSLRQTSLLVDQIKRIRETHKGISVDKIFALEGKLLLSSINCILLRIKSIYGLDGSESHEELEAKRAAADDCEDELPKVRFDTVI